MSRPQPPFTSSFSHVQSRKSTNNAEQHEQTGKMETYLSHFFPPQRQPDCRASAQGIVGVMIPRGPRFKIELVSSRSREHCERHNSFSCSEKTVACRCAASYRRGLVSAAAARPLPRRPSPTRKPWADSASPGTHAATEKKKCSSTFRRPAAQPPATSPPLNLTRVRRGWRLPLAHPRRKQKETRAGAGVVHPRRLPVVSSILYVQHCNLRAIEPTGRTPATF